MKDLLIQAGNCNMHSYQKIKANLKFKLPEAFAVVYILPDICCSHIRFSLIKKLSFHEINLLSSKVTILFVCSSSLILSGFLNIIKVLAKIRANHY